MEQNSTMGGWGRLAVVIGIALSIVWSGAMLVRGSEQMRVQVLRIADGAKKSCEGRGEKDCSRAWFRAYFEAENRQRDTFVLLKPGVLEALVPVLLGWLIAYGIISATRWVAEGFKRGNDQREHADRPHRGRRDTDGDGLDKEDGATTRGVAMVRVVHNSAVTLLVVSFGFVVAAVVASNTAGFESWRDGLATTALWNGVLGLSLYAFLAVVLVSASVVRLIAYLRRPSP